MTQLGRVGLRFELSLVQVSDLSFYSLRSVASYSGWENRTYAKDSHGDISRAGVRLCVAQSYGLEEQGPAPRRVTVAACVPAHCTQAQVSVGAGMWAGF